MGSKAVKGRVRPKLKISSTLLFIHYPFGLEGKPSCLTLSEKKQRLSYTFY